MSNTSCSLQSDLIWLVEEWNETVSTHFKTFKLNRIVIYKNGWIGSIVSVVVSCQYGTFCMLSILAGFFIIFMGSDMLTIRYSLSLSLSVLKFNGEWYIDYICTMTAHLLGKYSARNYHFIMAFIVSIGHFKISRKADDVHMAFQATITFNQSDIWPQPDIFNTPLERFWALKFILQTP